MSYGEWEMSFGAGDCDERRIEMNYGEILRLRNNTVDNYSDLIGAIVEKLETLESGYDELSTAVKDTDDLASRVETGYVTTEDVDDIVRRCMCDTMNDLENRVESLESNDFDDLEYRIESLEDKDIDDIDYRLSQAESSIQDIEYSEYVNCEDVEDMIRERTKELEQKIEEMNNKEWSITVLKAKIYDLYIQNGIIK